MSGRQTRGTGIAFERSLRRRIALVPALASIGLALGAPASSAGLVPDAVRTVGSTLTSAGNAATSLPNAVPPAPAPPKAPVEAPVKVPIEATQPPSPPLPPTSSSHSASPVGGSGGSRAHSTPPSAGVPSADGAAGAVRDSVDGVRGSVDSVTSAAKETGTQAISSARSRAVSSRGSSAPQGSPDTSGRLATPRAIGASTSAPLSIRAAEVAALQRWFARVWPGVALGGDGTGLARAARAIGGDLLRPAAAAIAQSLLPVLPAAWAPGDSPSAAHSATADARQHALPGAPTVATVKKILFLAAIAALLAVLAFTIWTEFRAALPRVR